MQLILEMDKEGTLMWKHHADPMFTMIIYNATRAHLALYWPLYCRGLLRCVFTMQAIRSMNSGKFLPTDAGTEQQTEQCYKHVM